MSWSCCRRCFNKASVLETAVTALVRHAVPHLHAHHDDIPAHGAGAGYFGIVAIMAANAAAARLVVPANFRVRGVLVPDRDGAFRLGRITGLGIRVSDGQAK